MSKSKATCSAYDALIQLQEQHDLCVEKKDGKLRLVLSVDIDDAEQQNSIRSHRGVKAAFSKRNRWGKGTKTRSAIDVIIASNGKAALDIDMLANSAGGDVALHTLRLCANFAMQTFDCMRQSGWLDLNNPDVQTFIKSIEVNHD